MLRQLLHVICTGFRPIGTIATVPKRDLRKQQKRVKRSHDDLSAFLRSFRICSLIGIALGEALGVALGEGVGGIFVLSKGTGVTSFTSFTICENVFLTLKIYKTN